ncbi:hypothetical protein [Nannocystis pusilla]|uniref:hypothetical protein n=1 Tax=Nannocystis pusilla TaxID=889268 RepID=UPI003B827599
MSFPAYRFRFYEDAARTKVVAELPPALPPGDPFSSAPDPDGNPVTGPNFFPQLFTTDPGAQRSRGAPTTSRRSTSRRCAASGERLPTGTTTSRRPWRTWSRSTATTCSPSSRPSPCLARRSGTMMVTSAPEALTKEQKSDLVAFLRRL